ncbi:NAD(P)H-binding protein [Noviherbaspirillum sp. CPCC 100848]|uniref:NAD(P)H-binding protein n=1 Tax=Noviherbaspirillum album TaxID=3080276 RepID=A0ABU6JE14_9BURK|nr:NAD(P)H-binding protein [Noviherbaspirillum sp. CPCC 100848]MEC4721895.1 NAD(P)H-binding protein [Noviherbaspirillum sp. CPCC 100848]
MVVLLTGGSGFIGSHLAEALLAAGHQVVCAVRNPDARRDPRFQYVAADFTRDFDASAWMPRLQGVDVVVNAVGIIRERGVQTFDAIHVRAPIALFDAAARCGVRKIVQISALGADELAQSRYHLSKKQADDFLSGLAVPSVVVQPSLVFGPGGTSARLFTALASLPLIALPGGGHQQVQPVHLDDLVAAIMALLEDDRESPTSPGGRVAIVGPEPMSLRQFLATLRTALGWPRAHFIPVPMPLVRLGASAGRLLPGSLLDPETLQMLERGNTGSAARITELLGRPPRAVRDFIAPQDRAQSRLQAKLAWLLPVLRISIALVWIVTGIVSLGLYPVEDSYALLARTGITGAIAPLMLYGAALLDLAFGIGTLMLKRGRRWLWLAQLGLIGFYTIIISFRLPEFWLHPYGPLLKNLPMLAAIWLLLELEEPDEPRARNKHNPVKPKER